LISSGAWRVALFVLSKPQQAQYYTQHKLEGRPNQIIELPFFESNFAKNLLEVEASRAF
jgi:hypothetical protein